MHEIRQFKEGIVLFQDLQDSKIGGEVTNLQHDKAALHEEYGWMHNQKHSAGQNLIAECIRTLCLVYHTSCPESNTMRAHSVLMKGVGP